MPGQRAGTPEGFEWFTAPWGSALRCTPLSQVADHLFTTRQLRLHGSPEAENDGWAAAAAELGIDPKRLARLMQVHGTSSVVVPEGYRPGEGALPRADMALSNDPAFGLAVQTADCVPLLLGDPRTGSAAAVHAGWRGMVARAPASAVQRLTSAFGARPGDIVAAAGPSIGPCCYEVGADVREAFESAGHTTAQIERWFLPMKGRQAAQGKWLLDLWTATSEQLAEAGVAPERVHLARLCTACRADLFCSYRRDGPRAGRQAAIIRAKGPRPRPSPG